MTMTTQAAKTESNVDDWPCEDSNGNGWPEHDWPSYSNECRRCGAETDDPNASATVDFDTRLELAAIGMDVRTSLIGGDALTEAHEAVAAAVHEASRTVNPAPAPDDVRTAFRSHPILKAAGDVIRTRGWAQGTLEDRTGAVCAMGAINAVSGSAVAGVAMEELRNRIEHVTGKPYSISAWNDVPGRTKEEVLGLLF